MIHLLLLFAGKLHSTTRTWCEAFEPRQITKAYSFPRRPTCSKTKSFNGTYDNSLDPNWFPLIMLAYSRWFTPTNATSLLRFLGSWCSGQSQRQPTSSGPKIHGPNRGLIHLLSSNSSRPNFPINSPWPAHPCGHILTVSAL